MATHGAEATIVCVTQFGSAQTLNHSRVLVPDSREWRTVEKTNHGKNGDAKYGSPSDDVTDADLGDSSVAGKTSEVVDLDKEILTSLMSFFERLCV